MSHLTAPEADGELYFISPVEKLLALAALRIQVVSRNLWLQPNLFQFDGVLISARFTLFLALLIPVLTVVHQPANRRNSVRRNFNEIEPARTRHFKRIPGQQNADLLAFLVNYSDFPDTNTLIDAGLNWSGNGQPPDRLGTERQCSGNIGVKNAITRPVPSPVAER